jgi:hypothetical protein
MPVRKNYFDVVRILERDSRSSRLLTEAHRVADAERLPILDTVHLVVAAANGAGGVTPDVLRAHHLYETLLPPHLVTQVQSRVDTRTYRKIRGEIRFFTPELRMALLRLGEAYNTYLTRTEHALSDRWLWVDELFKVSVTSGGPAVAELLRRVV